MIMMRSNPTTKLGGKPPPPVPPRPSKSLVQEALAKTRKVSASPARPAPQPPNNDLAKSKSSVNIVLKKPSYDRSISEEMKAGSRPIVYMSSNVKTVNKINQEDSVKMVECVNDKIGFFKKIESDECKLIEKCDTKSTEKDSKTDSMPSSASSSKSNSLDKKWDKMLNDRNHVNTLIDEMFASVLEVSGIDDSDELKTEVTVNDNETTQITINNNVKEEVSKVDPLPKTVIIIKDETTKNDVKDTDKTDIKTVSPKKEKHEINDISNHELLITELQNMKLDQERIMKRQRKPSLTLYDKTPESKSPENEISKIQCSDWVELGDGGEEVRLSSCQITIEDLKNIKDNDVTLDCER